ncbi:MAG: sulfite exporter TauE/SafE family protein [Solirubrobacteraceae bacterium]
MSLTMVAFGFAVGLLVGITGTGGGSVMTPLLVVVFGINPVTAIGTDIAYSAVEKTVGGVRQFRAGNVDVPLSTRMAFGSVPAAILGVIFLKYLERHLGSNFETVIFSLLAAALLLTGAALLARVLNTSRGNEHDAVRLTRAATIQAIVLGACVGFVVGLTSAGSGALIAVGLILWFRLRPRKVVGTDLFHASIVLWAAGIAHVFAGDIDYGLAGTLLVGAIPGVLLSTQISLHAPQGALRGALALVLLGAGLGMLSKAGVAIPSAALAIAPAIVIGLVGGAVLKERGVLGSPRQVHVRA